MDSRQLEPMEVDSQDCSSDAVAQTSSGGTTMEGSTEAANIVSRSCHRIAHMSRYSFGVLLILLVAVIWVGASEWIQWIFGSLDYSKPYFLTYFNTTGFCFWNLGFLSASWRRIPVRHTAESRQLAGSVETRKYSLVELVRCAAMFCPLWFLANSLFNYSLSLTSVASNTILSSTSTVWTLLLSRLILGQPITAMKVAAVLLCLGGTVMVAFADDHSKKDGTHELVGDVVALLSAFFYAAYTTVLKWCLPDESMYNMGMVFGFVGVLNLAFMWPGLILVDLLNIEHFQLPPTFHVFWALAVNSIVGTNLSDVLWAKSVVLTSPLVATLGLSLTTPLAMIADFALKDKHFSALYVGGAILVVVGFTVSNVAGDKCPCVTYSHDADADVSREAACVHVSPS